VSDWQNPNQRRRIVIALDGEQNGAGAILDAFFAAKLRLALHK
jgi:hypothetical protein